MDIEINTTGLSDSQIDWIWEQGGEDLAKVAKLARQLRRENNRRPSWDSWAETHEFDPQCD